MWGGAGVTNLGGCSAAPPRPAVVRGRWTRWAAPWIVKQSVSAARPRHTHTILISAHSHFYLTTRQLVAAKIVTKLSREHWTKILHTKSWQSILVCSSDYRFSFTLLSELLLTSLLIQYQNAESLNNKNQKWNNEIKMFTSILSWSLKVYPRYSKELNCFNPKTSLIYPVFPWSRRPGWCLPGPTWRWGPSPGCRWAVIGWLVSRDHSPHLWLVQGPISSISSSNCFSGRYSPTYRVPEHQMKRCNNPVTSVTNKTTVGRFAKILL